MNQTPPLIAKVAINTPLRTLFDYVYTGTQPALLRQGVRVKVPFGKRSLIGIVMGVGDASDIPLEKCKAIEEIIDPHPIFPADLCDFFTKAAQYYHHPIGEVIFSGLPQDIRQGKVRAPEKRKAQKISGAATIDETTPPIVLNAEQSQAIQSILEKQNQFSVFLLAGITGSGKTEVYLACTQALLASEQQTLLLVPEISLTPQTIQRFEQRFGSRVGCFHSQMTPAQRRDLFYQVQQKEVNVVIGTRSALFLPFQALGLIIIDEEHDASFKQQEGFRYSARDLAVLRAKLCNIPIILGSATPSFETLLNVQKQKYHYLQLNQRATNSSLPDITLLDVRHKKLNGGISAQLMHQIKQTIDKQEQVLLFINRRGYAPVFMCYDCGWFAGCTRCETRMTLHLSKKILSCHHCEKCAPIPVCCPQCQSTQVNTVGQGSEQIESVLSAEFPDAGIVRVDKDTTAKKGNLDAFLQQAQKNEANILIGTQMLAKGHHFPHLSLVAVLDADGGLFSVDFRAQERMAQLLIQVCGRAGRERLSGKVFIQTYHPEHPFMQQIIKQDYPALAAALLQERQKAMLPPFTHIALIRTYHVKPELGQALLQEAQQHLQQFFSQTDIRIKGPIPSPIPKRQGRYHFQLLLESNHRHLLHQAIGYSANYMEKARLGKKVRWSLDVDPIEMI